jgi:capsid protein
VSRGAVIAESAGEDAELVDAAIAEDQARADRLGLSLDSDGRRPKAGPSKLEEDDEDRKGGGAR